MEVTQTIFEQYKEVQKSGRVNMTNKTGVQRVANEMELYELVTFIEDGDYYELIQNYGKYDNKY